VDDWKRYRLLRWQAFFGWLGGCYLGRFPSDLARLYYAVFHSLMNLVIYWLLYGLCAVAAFSLLIFTWTRLGRWPCPRCGRLFFSFGQTVFGKDFGSNPFRWRCRYCRLRKWACD
jgi:hypothetical protein